MAIYHVLIDGGDNASQVIERLKENYEHIYPYHQQERIFFVHTDDISDVIAKKIGIRGDDKIEGVGGAVYQMSRYYSGYTEGGVWEWLANHGY